MSLRDMDALKGIPTRFIFDFFSRPSAMIESRLAEGGDRWPMKQMIGQLRILIEDPSIDRPISRWLVWADLQAP